MGKDTLLNIMVRTGYRSGYLVLRVWWFLRRPATHGAAVALWHGGKILMVRTSYRSGYSLPGGFVGRGEPAERAARRELLEEVGIDLQSYPLTHAWNGTLDFESRRDTVDIWEASLERAPALHVTGREVIWAGWMSPSQALAQRLLPHAAAYLAHR